MKRKKDIFFRMTHTKILFFVVNIVVRLMNDLFVVWMNTVKCNGSTNLGMYAA